MKLGIVEGLHTKNASPITEEALKFKKLLLNQALLNHDDFKNHGDLE